MAARSAIKRRRVLNCGCPQGAAKNPHGLPVPKWWIVNGPRRDGPYDEKQIIAFLRSSALNGCDLAIAVGTANQKALRDLPEFAPVVREIAAAAPPPTSSASAAPASVPFKVGEQLGSLRKKLPGLKKEAGERLGSLKEKLAGLKKEDVVARIRRVGKFLFGVLCWLLIEAWAVCLATKDQTVRLAAYAVKRFKAWRAGKGNVVDTRERLWPSNRLGWIRIAIGYGTLALLLFVFVTRQRDPARQLIAAALKYAPLIVEAKDKASAYSEIAKAKARAGDVAGAKATAAQIADKDSRSLAYRNIAEAQAKAGDITGAKATAAQIADESPKSSAYCAIAMANRRRAMWLALEAAWRG